MLNIAVILVLALAYGYLNGVSGAASIVSTMISSRALGPRQALILTALGISAGPFLLGVGVATTIGTGLITPDATTTNVVITALLSTVIWTGFTQWLRIPSSTSQSLVGALIGAVWVGFGLQDILMPGLWKTLISLFLSPVLGLIVGFWLVRLSYFLSASTTPHINQWFKRGQVMVSFVMAVAFGANDGQKVMGMVILGLIATGFMNNFAVPLWVILFSTAAISLGVFLGGWRLIHTLGAKFYKIRPIHGFGAQIASGAVILGAAVLGGPVSSSQVVTSAIVGAGSADRIQKVRWGVVQQILIGWILTLPFSVLLGAVIYLIVERVST